MASMNFFVAFLFMCIVVNKCLIGVNCLSVRYYSKSCPHVDGVVKVKMYNAFRSDPTIPASLLRMHFHDCFVEGCDGSVLIDSTQDNKAEKDSPANLSLRGYEIIDQIKEELEAKCPGIVSCADIVAMGARDAVVFAGGPYYTIPKGRMDGRRSKLEDTFRLPENAANSSVLIRVFGQLGFTPQEMVALSGAHTLGVARCSSFKRRLKNFDPTHDTDPSLEAEFANTLAKTCASGDTTEIPFDATKNTFDNNYFIALLSKKGILSSDQTLFSDPRTQVVVSNYATNQRMFFNDFARAMVKMGEMGVKEGVNGEVRRSCRKIN